VIFKIARPYLNKAILLKACESICYILLTLVIKIFLPEVEHPSTDRIKHKLTLFLSIFCATVLAFLTHLFGEHSRAQIFKAKSIASQTLRALLFSKISKANSNFLKQTDTSIIEKIAFFDFKSLTNYVEQYPNFFNFPIVVIASALAMSFWIQWSSLLAILIFLIFYIILYFMMKSYENFLLKSEFYCSERTSLVAEVLRKLTAVKTEAAVTHFYEKIHYFRHKEMHALHSAAGQHIHSLFVMSLAPIVTIFVIIMFDIILEHKDKETHTIYIIVSIVTTMHKQFKKFLSVVDQHHHFDNAIRHFNSFYFVIPDKSSQLKVEKQDKSLPRGSLEMKKC